MFVATLANTWSRVKLKSRMLSMSESSPCLVTSFSCTYHRYILVFQQVFVKRLYLFRSLITYVSEASDVKEQRIENRGSVFSFSNAAT